MKKLLWALVILAIGSFIVWSSDPLNQAANFLIGGSVPGTKIVLGFWPTLGVAATIVLLIKRSLKNARLKMMEEVTRQTKEAKVKAEFKEQHSSEPTFDRSKRSVIAAPTFE
jgi:hypothetical protein